MVHDGMTSDLGFHIYRERLTVRKEHVEYFFAFSRCVDIIIVRLTNSKIYFTTFIYLLLNI